MSPGRESPGRVESPSVATTAAQQSRALAPGRGLAARPEGTGEDPGMTARRLSGGVSAQWRGFWTERRPCTLVTLRPDGTPHAVPVGATVDVEQEIVRVICSDGSQKARNVSAAGTAGLRVAVSQVDGRRWSTLEGLAVVRAEPELVRDAEERYARRYKVPRANPRRVVLEIAVDRVLGLA